MKSFFFLFYDSKEKNIQFLKFELNFKIKKDGLFKLEF